MSIDVIMPQMGESIAEGTITKWLKQVGDPIERDEPLFEISTDKVDAEIPSPAAGILQEIIVREGETVAINTVVARIGESAVTSAAPHPPAKEPDAVQAAPAGKHSPAAPPKPAPPQSAPVTPNGRNDEEMRAKRRETKSSPLVRKIADEHKIDISQISGTGAGSRVTKKDILAYIESGARPVPAPETLEKPPAMALPEQKIFPEDSRIVREPMSVMRKRIAEHMLHSKRTSAHVTTVFEVDMSNVFNKRAALKEEYAKEGVKLTFLPFIIESVIKGLKAFPVMNASIEGETIIYKKDINIGIAVALDWGLIVPVIKHADNMSLLGLSKTISDLADRARSKRLNPEEVQNGTFTITNPGVFGSVIGTPIISQPQVAILDVGGITKRPVVINDAIAIRPMVYLSLSFDHRLIDGAVADQFLAFVKTELQTSPQQPCP